jgi:Phosphate-selective porin O and P
MKKRHVRVTILAVSLLAAPAVLAQGTVGVGNPASAPSEAAPPVIPSVEPATPATEAAAPATPALDQRLSAVESKLAGTEETVGAMQASVDALKKLRISGFIQGRYEYHQDAVDGTTNAKNENRFYVRHGYLGARYEGKNAEFFMQIDANNNDGVVLKDAEASFVDTWTPLHLKLTMGQFKVPFGYEILQSDADRELPERSQVILSLFPGDRDRGLRLQGSYEMFRLNVALVNGASFGQKDPSNGFGVVQNGYDPNGFKTVVGRVGVDLGSLVGGFSWMWGRTLDTKFGLPDVTDGSKTAGKLLPDTYTYFAQTRLGADVQGYVDVPMLGGLAVKGEVIWARKTNLDYAYTPANSCLSTQSLGWMVTVVQNFGQYLGLALRLDQYDPLLASTVDSKCYEPATPKPLTAIANRDVDKLTRLGAALLVYGSANIKFTLSYEHPWEQTGPLKSSNDIVTAQLQARF